MSSLEDLDTSDWSAEAIELIPIDEREAAFGRYVLCYEIAAGGMGTVYLAREHGPGGFTRPVAIKRIHPHLARKRRFVDMFLDEARVAARIIHPNVCSVYGFGEVRGTNYIAMEYLVGQPLSEVAPRIAKRPEIAGAPAWHALAARIVADACEGLHAAHELRDEAGQPLHVIHRDVSTHNVFVTYDGAVKVLDFGIARARGRTHETRTGTVKGKLAYMSPEQARASKAIDRRSDVWSLGVVLWELLALRRLFGRRSDVELLRAVAEEPIVPPSLVRPEVPPELDAIVMRALERDVEQRYPTARALARDLGAYVSKSGEAPGLGELADLLGELFARERDGKLVAIATVMHTDTADRQVAEAEPAARPPVAWSALMGEATTITSPPANDEGDTPRSQPPEIADDPPQAIEPTPPLTSAAPVAQPRPWVRWVPWIAAGGAAGIALALIATLGVQPMTDEAPRPEALAPTAATVPAVEPAVEPAPQREPPREPDEGHGGQGAERRGAAPVDEPHLETDIAEPIEPAATSDEDAAERPSATPEGDRAVPEAEPDAPIAAPRSERPPMGRVNVAATGGWADIYVRGRFVARTPHALRLPAGQHVIELRPGGGGPARRVTVRVPAGGAARVVVPLRPRTENPY